MGLREKWLQAQSSETLPATGADTMLQEFEVREFVLGEHIFQAGDAAHEFYIILSGTVLVYLECAEGTQTIAELKAPDFLGERSCLQGEPHSANALATASCRVLVIPEGEAEQAVARLPRWFVTQIETLLIRLRDADERLARACLLDNDFR